MAEHEEWEILSDSSNTNCTDESPPCLIVSADMHCPLIHLECNETVECAEPACLSDSYSSMPPLLESSTPFDCEEPVCLSDSYSSMPPLLESSTHQDVPNDELRVETDHDPMLTIHEYSAVMSLLQLRHTPRKKVAKRMVPHTLPHRPMTRSFAKKLSESTPSDRPITTRPMTRLYKKQLGL